MEITRLEKDVQNVSALSDYPNSNDGLTSSQLKETFDKASVDIKEYLNNTLAPEIEQIEVNVADNYATKDELRDVQIGQLIDGTVTLNKLSEDVQDKINKVPELENNLEDCKNVLSYQIPMYEVEKIEEFNEYFEPDTIVENKILKTGYSDYAIEVNSLSSGGSYSLSLEPCKNEGSGTIKLSATGGDETGAVLTLNVPKCVSGTLDFSLSYSGGYTKSRLLKLEICYIDGTTQTYSIVSGSTTSNDYPSSIDLSNVSKVTIEARNTEGNSYGAFICSISKFLITNFKIINSINKYTLESFKKYINNKILCIQVPTSVETGNVINNTINDKGIDTILKPEKYYELLYIENNDKFYASERRV